MILDVALFRPFGFTPVATNFYTLRSISCSSLHYDYQSISRNKIPLFQKIVDFISVLLMMVAMYLFYILRCILIYNINGKESVQYHFWYKVNVQKNTTLLLFNSIHFIFVRKKNMRMERERGGGERGGGEGKEREKGG